VRGAESEIGPATVEAVLCSTVLGSLLVSSVADAILVVKPTSCVGTLGCGMVSSRARLGDGGAGMESD